MSGFPKSQRPNGWKMETMMLGRTIERRKQMLSMQNSVRRGIPKQVRSANTDPIDPTMSSGAGSKRKSDDVDLGSSLQTSKQKRVKNDDTVSTNETPVVPALPASIWGNVLNYSRYEDVRKALLVCRMIANEAVQFVAVLNITKSCQLDVPAARRRFANVTRVNVFCLVLRGRRPDSNLIFDLNAVDKIPPFLSSFSALKVINVPVKLIGHYNLLATNRQIFHVYLRAILGLLKARVTPYVHSLNVIDGYHFLRLCYTQRQHQEQCCCRDICAFFPLKKVLQMPPCHFCIPTHERLDIIAKRPLVRETLSNLSSSEMANTIHFLGSTWTVKRRRGVQVPRFPSEENTTPFDDSEADCFKFIKDCVKNDSRVQALITNDPRLPAHQQKFNFFNIRLVTKYEIDCIDRMIAMGLDPSKITKTNLGVNSVARFFNGGRLRMIDGGYCSLWAKTALEALTSRGFNIDTVNAIVFDERSHPHLQNCVLPRILEPQADE